MNIMEHLVSLINSQSEVCSGILYLIIKVSLKVIIHKIAEKDKEIDNLPTYAWTFVDLAILSIVISYTLSVPEKFGMHPKSIPLFYVMIVFCTIISLLCYGGFIKIRQNQDNILHLYKVKLIVLFSCCSFFGSFPFIIILKNI